MSAADSLLGELHDIGVRLRVVDGRVHYAPKKAVPNDLRARMAACKDELLVLVERYEERAAIIEFDAGVPRAEAERRAMALIVGKEVAP